MSSESLSLTSSRNTKANVNFNSNSVILYKFTENVRYLKKIHHKTTHVSGQSNRFIISPVVFVSDHSLYVLVAGCLLSLYL